MTLVFASNNPNKIREIQQLVPHGFTIKSLAEIGCNEDIPETAATIEGNAALKADYVTQRYGFDCFADDTGLEVEALGGHPGVHSARYAGEHRNADDNNNKLLAELAGDHNRKARFKTVIALNLKGKQHFFEGALDGQIALEASGSGGFGYDPLFIPAGSDRTFAALSSEEKNRISHRGLAMKKLIAFLSELKNN